MTSTARSRREILKATAAISAAASIGTRRASAAIPAAKAAKAEIDQLLSGAVKNKLVIPGVVAMAATDDGILYQGNHGDGGHAARRPGQA
jgi:hypothetical protein